jgi:hypothetical protein
VAIKLSTIKFSFYLLALNYSRKDISFKKDFYGNVSNYVLKWVSLALSTWELSVYFLFSVSMQTRELNM